MNNMLFAAQEQSQDLTTLPTGNPSEVTDWTVFPLDYEQKNTNRILEKNIFVSDWSSGLNVMLLDINNERGLSLPISQIN